MLRFMLKLSILDQSTAAAGRGQDQAIRDTLALAEQAEALGYHRFWVSEHHNHDSIAGTAPEVLMAAIAARTSRIRIGSAGVMLPHYNALKVAEQFRVLDALAPGRIDLGVGRAPGGDRRTAYALNPHAFSSGEDEFPAQVRDLEGWIAGYTPKEGDPRHGVRAFPMAPSQPRLWMLGSSDYGAQLAAHFGLPYSFAYFITDGRGADQALEVYYRYFKPTPQQPEPEANVCVWALAAETREEAEHLFMTRARWRQGRDKGELLPLQTPEAATAYDYTPAERAKLERDRQRALIGTPAELGVRLRELAASLKVQELVILTWTHDPAAKLKSYQLLAEEFNLSRS